MTSIFQNSSFLAQLTTAIPNILNIFIILIELTKNAWNVTNGKNKFLQMTVWLEYHKKIFFHMKHIK